MYHTWLWLTRQVFYKKQILVGSVLLIFSVFCIMFLFVLFVLCLMVSVFLDCIFVCFVCLMPDGACVSGLYFCWSYAWWWLCFWIVYFWLLLQISLTFLYLIYNNNKLPLPNYIVILNFQHKLYLAL